MGVPIVPRLPVVLTALAFVLMAAISGTGVAMPMPGNTAADGNSGILCGNCPSKASAGDLGTKMTPCGVSTCAGVAVALPALAGWSAPRATAFEYATRKPDSTPGIVLPPDPFPPRPASVI